MNAVEEEYLTPVEAAKILNCQRTNIYAKINSGKLTAIEGERGKMVTKASVLALVGIHGDLSPKMVAVDHSPEPDKALPPAASQKSHQLVEMNQVDAELIDQEVVSRQIDGENLGAEERKVVLAQITFDDSLQVRAMLDEATVVEYAERMRSGERFPPVQLFRDCNRYYIGDGWHRLAAARALGYVSFPAVVSNGGRTAALKFALSANACHGLPRSNADKMKAIEVAAFEFPNVSNREIARLCAVSESFVRAHRSRCAQNAPEKRVGSDGKTYAASRNPAKPSALLANPELVRQANEAQVRRVSAVIERLNLDSLKSIFTIIARRIASLSPVDKVS